MNEKLTQRIGTTTYRIKIHFTETENENMEDKILRLIANHPLAEREWNRNE